MSDIAFRSQQFAQGAQQWSEEMQTRSSERYGQAIEGMGQSISQIPERAIGMAGAMQDLQLKQQEAESQLMLDEMRRQKFAQDTLSAHAILDLDIKTAEARMMKYRADALAAQNKREYESSEAGRALSADTQRAHAMMTVRTGKLFDVSGGRMVETGAASPEDMKRAESVLRGSRTAGSLASSQAETRRLAESLFEAGHEEESAALYAKLSREAGVEGGPPASQRSDEVVNWIVGRLGEHGINESVENAARIGRYLSTQTEAIHGLANSEQAKGRGKQVSRDEAMDWFLEWVSRDENFRRQLYAKAGIR